MVKRWEVLRLIDRALEEILPLHAQYPETIAALERMIEDVRERVVKRWPLTIEEQKNVSIGPIGVRQFDSPEMMDKAALLARLDEMLRPDAPR